MKALVVRLWLPLHPLGQRHCNCSIPDWVIAKGIAAHLREQVVGRVLPENNASVTVLLKVDLDGKKNLELFGFKVEKYTLLLS